MTRLRVAIIGGGPGGLMTAYRLETRHPGVFDVTLFEASPRLGGKVLTPRFGVADVPYEAGAAELYDYSHLGPDPLRELVAELGLPTHAVFGEGVILANRLVADLSEFREAFGEQAASALADFENAAKVEISPPAYYESDWRSDNADPMAAKTFAAVLEGIGNDHVRRYIEIAIHSDLATEPDLTSGTYGLQNCLMNHREYMRLYGIDGGMERLPNELARRLKSTVIRLNQPVVGVEKVDHDAYQVRSRRGNDVFEETVDFVVVALPNTWIPFVEWHDDHLARAMRQHVNHYRHHAHYLRVSLLYDRPFWRERIGDPYFMIDAFGGCCVYDESLRNGDGTHGVLGLLIAGEPALTLANLDDARLIDRARRALPPMLGEPSAQFLEGRVHRWLGAVNALPGGRPLHDPDARHIPDPEQNPWLFVVGDYLFDTTLNGVLDSADTVVEMLIEEEAEARTEDERTLSSDPSGEPTAPAPPAVQPARSLPANIEGPQETNVS